MPLPTTTNVTRPRALGYDVRIESNYYRLIPPLSITDESTKNPMSQQLIRNPEDVALISEDALPLSQTDFSGGEGLDFAHRPTNTDFDKTRFWDSTAIEVVEGHGDVQKIQLAKQFTAMRSRTDTSIWHGGSQVDFTDGSLFIIDNSLSPQRVVRFDDPLNSTTNVGEDPFAGEATNNMQALASVNGELYVSIATDGVHKRDSAGTWTHFSGQPPRRMWGLKGRILGSYLGTELRLYESTGTSVLQSLPAGEEFRAATDAGAAILVGASNGQVYAYADVDGTLTLRAQTPFPQEEIVGLGAGPSGIVLVGTRSQGPDGLKGRLYMGELGSSYTIQNAQLLREWNLTGALQGHAPSFITFHRDQAHFFVSPSGSQDEIWVFDATTTGIFRLQVSNLVNTDFSGAVVVDGRLFFADRARSLYREETTYQSSGYLISPLFDHFSAEEKVWAAARFFGVNFPTNTAAELFYSTNPDAIEDNTHTSWTSIKSLTSVDDAEALISNATDRWITFKIELSTSDSTATPQVRGYSSRAYTGAGDTTIPLTINCSDRLERRGRKAKTIPGLGKLIYNELKTLEGSGVEIELLWNEEVFEGTVRSVSNRAPVITSRGSQLLASQVEFVGRRK